MSNREISLDMIKAHYDSLSALYLRYWGEHIHHGYFEDGEPPAVAQERLVSYVAERAAIARGARVLDVGCGLGGSAFWLAGQLGCSVHGITISPVQAALARRLARERGLRREVEFSVTDAACLRLSPESFDVVWVIECAEHLDDKAAFVRRCARLLRRGGVLAVCSWLSKEDPDGGEAALLEEIRGAMLCPSIATSRQYADWMVQAGLVTRVCDDLTDSVAPTWKHCATLARRPAVRLAALLRGRSVRRFVSAFPLMREAMACGVLRYGLFVADSP